MPENEQHDATEDQQTNTGLDNYGKDDDGQDYVDRSVIDFDPADGLLSGTAIDGTSDIPDPDEVADGDRTEEPKSDE